MFEQRKQEQNTDRRVGQPLPGEGAAARRPSSVYTEMNQTQPRASHSRYRGSGRRTKLGLIAFLASLVVILVLLTALILVLWSPRREPNDYLLPEAPASVWREEGQTTAYKPSDPRANAQTLVWPYEDPLPWLHAPDTKQLLDQLGQSGKLGRLDGLTVFLDPGHGGRDSGTVWPAEGKPEFMEKDVTLPLSIRIQKDLEQAGAKVYLLRDKDEFLSIYHRTAQVGEILVKDYLRLNQEAKNAGQPAMTDAQQRDVEALLPLLEDTKKRNIDKDGGLLGGVGASRQARLLYEIERQYLDCIYLSVHVNYSESTTVGGTQVYVLRNYLLYQGQNVEADPPLEAPYNYVPWKEGEVGPARYYPLYLNYNDAARSRLGRCLYKEIAAGVPQLITKQARSVIDQNFAVLRTCNLPGVLLETGFIENPKDRELLWSESGQRQLSRSVTEGLKRYLREMQEYYRSDENR